MKMQVAIGASVIGLIVTGGVLAASAEGRAYKSGVSVVSLGVTVTDARQKDVAGLAREDFAVFEDGRPQEVRYFAAEPTPLDLAILLDTSASMNGSLGDVQEAALQLGGALRPGDRASFTEVKRGMRDLQPLSADTSGLARAIRATTPGGSTAIYDAIYTALRTLTQAAPPTDVRRQALVVLSDGDDTASLLRYDDVLDAARRNGVTIYAVSLRFGGPVDPRTVMYIPDKDKVHGDYALRSLAQQTGGQAFFNQSHKNLAATCRRIAYELGHQYSLGYVSNNPRADGRFRLLSVQMVSAPGARARTRQGYFAAPEDQPSAAVAEAQSHAQPQAQPQTQAVHVRGTVTSVEGEVLTVSTSAGPETVRLAPATTVATVVPSKREHITDGSFVGITSVSQPDGSQRATEVHVFPDAMRGTGQGSYAWDAPGVHGQASHMTNGTAAPSKMTNGTVAPSKMTNGTVSASRMTNGTAGVAQPGAPLTVRYNAGGSNGVQTITIPPGIPVVAIEPGARGDLQPGAHVFIVAHRNAEGVLTADRILAGKNGVVPPM
jgi:VWFA-related protein